MRLYINETNRRFKDYMENRHMSGLKEIREKILVNIKEVVGANEEKIEDAYKRVMRLEYIARREGLLALEYEAEFIPKETLLCNEITEMIEMVVDGTEPSIFEELMTIKFFTIHNYTPIDALLYYFYARSMLMIQAGMSPRLIEELFNAVVPNEMLTFERERMKAEEDKRQKITERKSEMTEAEKELLDGMSKQLQNMSEEEWKTVVSSKGFYGLDKVLPYMDEDMKALAKNYMNDYRYYVIMRSPDTVTEQELEELDKELNKVINGMRGNKEMKGILDDIQKCTDEEIQCLLRQIDNLTLAVALKGAGEETAECFYRNLSVRLRRLIQEDMEYLGPVRMCDVEEAEKKIMKVAKNVLNWEEVLRR